MQSLATFTGFKPAAAPRSRLASTRAPRAARRGAVVTEAKKKSVGDLTKKDLEGQVVFVRCDLNVPMDADLNITDDTRIRAALPTLEYLAKNGAKAVVTSHLVGDARSTRDAGTFIHLSARRGDRGPGRIRSNAREGERATDARRDDANENRVARRADRRISSD